MLKLLNKLNINQKKSKTTNSSYDIETPILHLNICRFATEHIVGGGLKVLEPRPGKEGGGSLGELVIFITVNPNLTGIKTKVMLCK